MPCTKPNCDCVEKAEEKNGGPVKYGYPCLHHDIEEEMKSTVAKDPFFERKAKENIEGKVVTMLDLIEEKRQLQAEIFALKKEKRLYNEDDMEKAWNAGQRSEILKYNHEAKWITFADWIKHHNSK